MAQSGLIDRRSVREFDWVMFLSACLLVLVGMAFIWSASFPQTDEPEKTLRNFLELPRVRNQLRSFIVALILFFIVIRTNYRTISGYAYTIYAIALVGLVASLVIGVAVKGASRWLEFGGQRFQPSEIAKVAFVLALSKYLAETKNYKKLLGLVIPILLTIVPTGLIFIQPDIGTALLFAPVMLIMLFTAGARLRHLIPIALLGASSLPAACILSKLGFHILKPYQIARILSFLNPNLDAHGSGYQLVQSLIAIGSGGLTGKGLGNGTQNRFQFLPERHTDFIFSVIGEEWGFIGAVFVLVLYTLIVLGGFNIAGRTRDICGRLIAVGGTSFIAIQAFINMGMTIRLCPITGLTLPFVSYGGSSMVGSFLMLGLVISVGMRRPIVFSSENFE